MDLVDKLNEIEKLLTEINDVNAEIEKNPTRYEANLIKIKNKALRAIRKNNRKFGFLVIVLAERRKNMLWRFSDILFTSFRSPIEDQNG